jgi:NhaA family Na+:H+ antiporter
MARLFQLVIDNSLLLVAGALTALVWANIDVTSYTYVSHALEFLVNDVAMVFFFALAAKEVVAAMLPGGPLSSPREAGLPVFAAVGGMAVPALIFLAGARVLHQQGLTSGWAIPCATDIAFSYLAARLIFPKSSPAIPFLLLLAIADDALGLIVLAVFYPSAPLEPGFLAMGLIPALVLAWTMRRYGIKNFWWYLLVPGMFSWVGLLAGGVHPALALVPIIPFMPATRRDQGLFSPHDGRPHDTLSRFEHTWQHPVQFILFFFGLANAGVPFTSIGLPTWLVLGGLLFGKPIGVVGMTLLAELMGFRRPKALDLRALAVVGVAAGIGFTVALFFSTAAFVPGVVLNQAKMGALLSFLAAPLAVLLARALRIRRTA